MLKVCKPQYLIVTAMVCLGAINLAPAQDVPDLSAMDKYQTPVPYAGIRNWHVTQNLGPTGARGWVYGHRGHTRDSREILIKSVEPGSPADGVLEPYDIIVGAATPPATPATQWTTAPAIKPFDSDARLSMARAITWAETKQAKGELKLLVQRDDKTSAVVIKLPVMGKYAKAAPLDCAKSARIVKHAAAFLADQMPADGYFGLQGGLNAMLLYATEDDRYLDHVRRSAMRIGVNHKVNDAGHETWRWGYHNLFLAEYYLATGDKRVLPTMAEYCKVMAEGQCNPGTWGHRAVPDFIPPGYGSMNQSGLVCFLSMVLGRQAGIDVDKAALSNSIKFYGSYAGVGGIPYGDHSPANDSTCNGKNGSAAMAFYQLHANPAAQWFARMCGSANLGSFEGGHTGNFFNQTWSPLGASLAGKANYQRFWSRFHSYRDLARRADGSFVTQPLPHTREGDLGTGNYVYKGPMWTTGGYALSYLAGSDRLAVLGRRDSVFGANPPAKLKAALELYHQKKFEQTIEATRSLTGNDHHIRVSELAAQLQKAAQRNINSRKLTLADMQKNLEAGDLYLLKCQLQAIESIVDAGDDRLAPFRAAVEDEQNQSIIEAGGMYHRAVAGKGRAGLTGFWMYAEPSQTHRRYHSELSRIADNGPAGYKKLAAAHMQQYPRLNLTPDQPLTNAAAWRILPRDRDVPKTLITPSFNDSSWPLFKMSSPSDAGKATRYLRNTFDVADADAIKQLAWEYTFEGQMQVYLNGKLLLDIKCAGWPTTKMILLKPITRELLKAKGNSMVVVVTPQTGNEKIAFALKARMADENANVKSTRDRIDALAIGQP